MKMLALILFVCIVCLRSAQNYSIDWFTIEGGGGTSTGGVCSVSGTIGQADTGAQSGGQYSVTARVLERAAVFRRAKFRPHKPARQIRFVVTSCHV